MSSSPGTVRWTSQNRNSPSHGKCGLPTSSPPSPPVTRSAPTAHALLPLELGSSKPAGGIVVAVVDAASGGWAEAMKSVSRPPLASRVTERA